MADQPGNPGGTEDDEPGVQTFTTPFGKERDKRMAELEAMPGFRLNVDLAMLGRSGHVMYRNAEELARHADQFMRSRRPFARDANDQIEEFEKELVRYLHNYLTSVYSLIESQRVVMRHCWGDGSEFETGQYSEHRKASFDTGEAQSRSLPAVAFSCLDGVKRVAHSTLVIHERRRPPYRSHLCQRAYL
jgi:hypothetical protein